ncbi:hypothetical protein D3C80_1114310 [compost metagenome]
MMPIVTREIGDITDANAAASPLPTPCPLFFISCRTAESCVPCCKAICIGDMPIAAVTPMSWNWAAMFAVLKLLVLGWEARAELRPLMAAVDASAACRSL